MLLLLLFLAISTADTCENSGDQHSIACPKSGEELNVTDTQPPPTEEDIETINTTVINKISDTFSKQNAPNQTTPNKNIPNLNINEQNLNKPNSNELNLNKLNVNESYLTKPNVGQHNLNKPNINKLNLNKINVNESNLTKPKVGQPNLNINEQNLNKPNNKELNLYKLNVTESNLTKSNVDLQNLNNPNVNVANLIKLNGNEPNSNKPNVSKLNLDKLNVDESSLPKPNDDKQNLNKPNVNLPNLIKLNVSEPNLNKPNVHEANDILNLIKLNVYEPNLHNANVNVQNKRNVHEDNLNKTRLNITNLSIFNQTKQNLTKANLTQTNQIKPNVTKLDLIKINSTKTNLINFNLKKNLTNNAISLNFTNVKVLSPEENLYNLTNDKISASSTENVYSLTNDKPSTNSEESLYNITNLNLNTNNNLTNVNTLITNNLTNVKITNLKNVETTPLKNLPNVKNLPNIGEHILTNSTKNKENLINATPLIINNTNLTNVVLNNVTTIIINNKLNYIFNISCFNLLNLHAENNNISKFLNNTLPNLKVLNLSHNSLESLQDLQFNNLSSLRSLDLSANYFERVEDNTFVGLQNLTHLNISDNLIVELQELSFNQLVSLQHLDISFNKLKKVSPESLNLPSLLRLNLKGNKELGVENALLIEGTMRLQTVDVTMTGLNRIPLFITQGIKTLKLNQNNINLVKSGDFDSYTFLHQLDISGNNLSSIEYDALGRLENLSIIYLTDNVLSSIPKSLPWKLKVLHLERNLIAEIKRGDMDNLSNLEILNLRNNKIEVVNSVAFNGLVWLSYLDLSNNPIRSFVGSMTVPWHLHVLKLSNIDIPEQNLQSNFPVAYPEHITSIDLSKSKGLIRLFLNDTATLAASKELQEIDLSNGGLVDLRRDFLDYFPQLRRLLLDNNSLDCEKIRWIVGWMLLQNEEDYKNIVCAAPEEIWGFRLIDLEPMDDKNDFYHHSEITTSVPKQHTNNNKENNTETNYKASLEGIVRAPKNVKNKSAYVMFTLDSNTTAKTSNSKNLNKTKTKSNATSFIKSEEENIPALYKQTNSFGINEENKETAILNEDSNAKHFKINKELVKNVPYDMDGNNNFASSVKRSKFEDVQSPELLEETTLMQSEFVRATDASTAGSTTAKVREQKQVESGTKVNSTSGEMFMYSSGFKESHRHPGMLILGVCLLSGVVVLVVVLTRLVRLRRLRELERCEEMEVSSVLELW